MSCPDWNELKKEYITSRISLRALANKHNVSFSTIQKRSAADKWSSARKRVGDRTEEKTIEKMADRGSNANVKIYARANKILDKIDGLIDGIEELADAKLAADTLRSLKASLDAVSDAEMREQEARIDKLRREAAAENEGSKEITVRFADPEVEEWQR